MSSSWHVLLVVFWWKNVHHIHIIITVDLQNAPSIGFWSGSLGGSYSIDSHWEDFPPLFFFAYQIFYLKLFLNITKSLPNSYPMPSLVVSKQKVNLDQ
jgi:hypothetical protein